MALNTGGDRNSRPLGRTAPQDNRFVKKIPASGQRPLAGGNDLFNTSLNFKYPAQFLTSAPVNFMLIPKTATIAVAGTVDLDGFAFDNDSKPITVTQNQISWTSSDASKATVNASTGVVTGVATGSTTITGVWGKFVSSTKITVS